jgi:hypothetical protein
MLRSSMTHLESSATIQEVSFTHIYDVYSTVVTYDDRNVCFIVQAAKKLARKDTLIA